HKRHYVRPTESDEGDYCHRCLVCYAAAPSEYYALSLHDALPISSTQSITLTSRSKLGVREERRCSRWSILSLSDICTFAKGGPSARSPRSCTTPVRRFARHFKTRDHGSTS